MKRTPESEPKPKNHNRSSGKLRIVVGAALTTLMLTGAPQAAASVKQEVASASPAKSPEKTKPKDSKKKNQPKIGNVDLASLPLGTDYVSATRPNGEVIKVPRLDNSSPNALAATALNLMACYFTTGSSECLNALSTSQVVQQELSVVRSQFASYFASNENSQYAVFDDYKDPAIFTATTMPDGRQRVALSDGTLYAGRWESHVYGRPKNNSWQNPVTIRAGGGGLETTVDRLEFYIAQSTDPNKPLGIDGFAINTQPTPDPNR